MSKASTQEPGTIAPINSLPAGTRLQEYEIRSVIGEGGFGIVYLAYDTMLGREVAIKEYLPISHATRLDGVQVAARTPAKRELFEKGMQSFVSEARILARFKHPALVEVLRFWEDNGTAYMVMPYYRGKTLREMVRCGYRAKTAEELLSVMLPLMEGLSQMHEAACYHRDISSDNIIILENGSPVLLDFGAARHALVDQEEPATIILKPGFAPVEQYSNEENALEQGAWTDIYALSAVAYQLVTGEMPTISVARIMRDPLKPLVNRSLPGLPPEMLKVIDWGLAVRPENRPQTIGAFGDALQNALQKTGLSTEAVLDKEDGAATFAEAAELRSVAAGEMPPEAERRHSDNQPHRGGSEKRSGSLLWGGLAALLLIGLGVMFFVFSGEDAATHADADTLAYSDDAGTVGSGNNDVIMEEADPPPVTPLPVSMVSIEENSVIAADKGAEGEENYAPEIPDEESAIGQHSSPPLERGVEVNDDAGSTVLSAEMADGKTEDTPLQADIIPPAATHDSAASLLMEEPPPAHAQTASMMEAQTGQLQSGDIETDHMDVASEPAAGTGQIEVTVKPWGNVYLNGELVGTVPPRLRLDAPAGMNSIEIRNESNSPYVQEVEVRSGRLVRIAHDFYLAAVRVEADTIPDNASAIVLSSETVPSESDASPLPEGE